MKQLSFRKYYLLAIALIIFLSVYPLYMGVKVLVDFVQFGHVLGKNYHKYLIPYTPISLSLSLGAVLLPLSLRQKKHGQLALTILCVALFFAFELPLEQLMIVGPDLLTQLESWQMYMCYVPYNTHQATAIDILMGYYSPTFKLHFYMISLILIITVVNSLYGFGKIIRTGDSSRKRSLTLQTVATALFLGLCILACFTAFFRTGTILVSPLSAFLMALYFIVLGVTGGLFTLSLLSKTPRLQTALPAFVAGFLTLAMYLGEMCLLRGQLYRFGTGWFYAPLGKLVLAPVDLVIILFSSIVTALISLYIQKKQHT